MKRTILINQEVLFSIDQRLDFVDGAIFHYIVDFSHLAESKVSDKSIWFWISAKKVIGDMPMLKISSKRGISKRIDKLVDAGLLIRHSENQETTKSFYCFGPNYRRLIATNESSHLGTTVPSPLEQPFQAPRNESSDYNSIIDNSISDKSISDFEEKSQIEIETLEAEEIPNEEIFTLNGEERKKKVAPKKKEMDLFGEVKLWPAFEDFWDLYDKKTGKDKTEKKWEKLKQSEKEKIMQVIPDYIDSQPDKTYRKNPETYLNGKHWNDEIIHKKRTGIQQAQTKDGFTDLLNYVMS